MNFFNFGRSDFPVRPILAVLVIIAVLPPLLFAIVALVNYAESERDQATQHLRYSAQGVARAIDKEFDVAVTALTVLASSTLLDENHLPALDQRLRNTKLQKGHGFALFDPAGRQIINTNPTANMNMDLAQLGFEQWRENLPGQEVYISNVLVDERTREPFVFIAIPVRRNGTVKWTLGTFLYSGDFADVLRNPGVPEDWLVSVVDRNGVHIRRSHLNNEYAGHPLVPELVQQIKAGKTDPLYITSHEGMENVATVMYAPKSGWAAAMGMPTATLETPLWESIRFLGFIGLALVAAAIALAMLVAGTLVRAFSLLQTSARTLGQGGIVTPSTSLIREANNVVTVMSDVSLLLIERSKAVIDLNNSLETQVDERTATLVNEIARREESEKQLRQLYKLEAVGSLTGGIAHDFNNMLAVVMSGLNLARRRLARGETDIAQFLDGATRGAESAAKLTKQLLAFSRQQALSPEAVDCNRLITSMADMLRRTIPANIEIETALAGGLWRTCADVPALENAILNLSINARDAMAGVGKLTIETSNMHLDDTYAASHAEVTAGQYVMVAVTDTGTGIPAEIINEVFEPFFSTKELGQGTGLGLSQVYGFIKQSGGHINIYSEKNQGTTVKLYLPRLVNDAQLRDLTPVKPEKMPMSQNNELLLVVEDDAGVRAGTVAMLKELGYAVLEAEDGVNALHILETNPDIRLLMTDVVMPRMNGRQLADEAARRWPKLRVLFTTGYTRNAIVHHGKLDADVALIGKPYTLDALARKISEMLSS